nr:MAG TPA: hypothetical protein [Caudoviricetes sp.]
MCSYKLNVPISACAYFGDINCTVIYISVFTT